jgi:phosphopantothenoylcysteine synthetase/decarboxylase
MIVANEISGKNSAFGSEENKVTIFTKNKAPKILDRMDKKVLADLILDSILEIQNGR